MHSRLWGVLSERCNCAAKLSIELVTRGNLFDAILLCENHFEMRDLRLSDFGRIDRHIPIFPLRGRETKVIDFADARL